MKPTAALLLCLMTSLASAQSIYRCGNSYSESPCAEGGRVVDATDTRSPAQLAEARRVAADERRFAAELRRDRLADEKALKPSGATSLSGPVPATSALATVPHHPKKRARTKLPTGILVLAMDSGSRKRRDTAP
ncbi:MAG: hypothetical protein V4540_05235 [Pseudomonadota bacterium]